MAKDNINDQVNFTAAFEAREVGIIKSVQKIIKIAEILDISRKSWIIHHDF